MNATGISVASALVGVAVAALGLLLTWYRGEGKKPSKSSANINQARRQEQKRTVLVGGGCLAITIFTVAGVALALRSSSPERGSSAGAQAGSAPVLSINQYRAHLGQICSDGLEKAGRIEASEPAKTALGASNDIERDEIAAVKRLSPPLDYRQRHEDLIALWERKVSFLESMYQNYSYLSDDELIAQLKRSVQMNNDLSRAFKAVGVPECIISF